MRRHSALGLAALALLLGAGVGLLCYELVAGAASYGTADVADPCGPRDPFPGEGIDATLQRIALDGLDGAACELGTTREELVLSFEPRSGVDRVRWDEATIERTLRSALLRAVDEADERGSLGSVPALILREVVERAPLEWLIRGGLELADLL